MATTKKVYNVAVEVVDLIEAESGEAAIATLTRRLRAADFEVLETSGDAFESEEQG